MPVEALCTADNKMVWMTNEPSRPIHLHPPCWLIDNCATAWARTQKEVTGSGGVLGLGRLRLCLPFSPLT